MSMDKKSSKLKLLIGKLLNISEWKVKADGHLDVSDAELARITEEYGPDFIAKFEKLLQEEATGDRQTVTGEESKTKQSKSDMLKLELLCAMLGVQAITMSEDGTIATLNKEQLGKIEAGLKKLGEEKTAAESNLTTANTAKDAAVTALTAATTAMDELDATVKTAATTAAKVEAIRAKLASKPGAAATGAQNASDQTKKPIAGADKVTDYVKTIV